MYVSLLCLAFAAGPDDPNRARTAAAAPVSLDGTWTIVCLEKNGEAVADAKGKTVTAKDNTLICTSKDGKTEMTFKVEFAKPGMANVTIIPGEGAPREEAGAKEAVYVLTADYLAICLHDPAAPAAAANTPQSKSKCSIILKREGTRDR